MNKDLSFQNVKVLPFNNTLNAGDAPGTGFTVVTTNHLKYENRSNE